MPYLTQGEKKQFVPSFEPACTAGQLNYQLTEVVRAFLGPEAKYADMNAAIGALECSKAEILRRIVAPYEDHKTRQNGDVFQPRPDIEEGVF